MSEQGVAAVDRALAVLDAFVGAGPSALSLAALASRTGLYKSTLLRIAASLQRGGMLTRSEDGIFRLGPKTLTLGGRYQQGFDLGALVTPVLRRLGDATGESASFYVRDDDRRICLYRANATHHRITHVVPVGTVYALTTGAAGQIFSAFGADAGDASETVRASLYAVSLNQRTLSETGAVAVPVLGLDDMLVGTLGLTGPVNRFHSNAVRDFAKQLLEAARSLGETLGGRSLVYDEALERLTAT